MRRPTASQHDFHTPAYDGLCDNEADKMPQGKFRPLEVSKTGGALEYSHSKKQHQQPVTDADKRVVDAGDDAPNAAAFEVFRGLGQKRPYLVQLFIPAG